MKDNSQYILVKGDKLYLRLNNLNPIVIPLKDITEAFSPFNERDLRAYSLNNQSPTTFNSPIDINFENAELSGSGRVTLFSNNQITFNRDGYFSLRATLNLARVNSNQAVYLASRFVLDSGGGFIQMGETKGIVIESNRFSVPITIEYYGEFKAGDVVKVQLVRLNALPQSANDGGIITLPTTGSSFLPVASATLSVVHSV